MLLGRLTKKTTPAATEPKVRISVSLKSVFSKPTKVQDSRSYLWTFHETEVQWGDEYALERAAAVKGELLLALPPRTRGHFCFSTELTKGWR